MSNQTVLVLTVIGPKNHPCHTKNEMKVRRETIVCNTQPTISHTRHL